MNTPIRIKTFRCKSLQEAFEQIRNEFGPDAAILETKTKSGIFGRSRIEVTASSDTHSNVSIETPQADLTTVNADAEAVSSDETMPSTVSESEPKLASEPDTQEVTSQSNLPNVEIHNRLPEVASLTTNHYEPSYMQVLREMYDCGIDPPVAQSWLDAVYATLKPSGRIDAWTLRSELLSRIRSLMHVAKPLDLNRSTRQTIALVGPAGVGKSTTIAKLASNLSIEHHRKVGILSLDNVRLGTNQLLESYAEMLDWTFSSATVEQDVRNCMSDFAECDFLLIDTPGCSPTDAAALESLKEQLAWIQPEQTHLVLSSNLHPRSFGRYEVGFSAINPTHLVLTRLDESGGLGPLFSSLQCCAWPVSYLSMGPNIPADLLQATAYRLAQMVFG